MTLVGMGKMGTGGGVRMIPLGTCRVASTARRVLQPGGGFFLAALLALGGCASINGYPDDPEVKTTLAALQKAYFGPTADDNYSTLKDVGGRKAERDRIVLGRIKAYDAEFSAFQRALTSQGNSLMVGSDLAALVFSGFGATTGSAATKSALAAASGGVISAQGVVSKDAYYTKTIPALVTQMEANRDKIKLVIFTGLKQADAEYPLLRAESDLADLNDAGSLNNAVSSITQQATNAKITAQAETAEVQTMSLVHTATSDQLTAWIAPSNPASKTNGAALDGWITKEAALNKPDEACLKNTNAQLFARLTDTRCDWDAIRGEAIADPSLGVK